MQYRHIYPGLANELAVLPPAQAVDHLRNYLGNFLLDPVVATVYLNRLGAEQTTEPSLLAWMRYLITKYGQALPFDERVAGLLTRLNGTGQDLLRHLQKCRLPEAESREVEKRTKPVGDARQRGLLIALLRKFRFSTQIVEALFQHDLALNIPVGEGWLDQVVLPPALQGLLHQRLCLLRIVQGDDAQVASLLPEALATPNTNVLNHVAEFFARNGDTAKALDLYGQSLRLDPFQKPVEHRMAALTEPEAVDPQALDSRITILLYSWNKSELLGRTLESLAGSDIGGARVVVLLNGCTDDSAARVAAVNAERFHGRIEVLTLPVNIGAPAARNWLLTTEAARQAEYVAFLDDDVEVPQDWLRSLVSVLRRHPQAGVAGVKVLNPGSPKRLQYLFRNIAVALPGLIRVSLDTPNVNYDVGFYDCTRTTVSVMGCCHVFTRKCLDALPVFDIRFSPSQMDDLAHDIDVALAGFDVLYHGRVACVHHQQSGLGRGSAEINYNRLGNVQGNDMKFYYRFVERLPRLQELNNLAQMPAVPAV